MNTKYYFSYGSNCNLSQMRWRCPEATVYGAVTLRNYTLIFNGVASIRRRNGAEVKGVLWEITPECEQSLDRYEGYPTFYGKQNVTVYTEDGEAIKAMVYVMTPQNNRRPGLPNHQYYMGILVGFRQNGIPTDTLEAALEETLRTVQGGYHNEKASKSAIR